MENTINIDNRSSPHFVFSNDAKIGFFDNRNVWWSTATHYIEAKKFVGTHYEDVIRKTKTPMRAKTMTRRRKKVVWSSDCDYEIKSVFGPKTNGCDMVDNWNTIMSSIIKDAINYKFSQHPPLKKKLIDTYPDSIVSKDATTAQVLMEIRKDMRSRHPEKVIVKLSDFNLLRKAIMKISKAISSMEKWDRIFTEMVDDAIHNIDSAKTDIGTYTGEEYQQYLTQTRDRFTKMDSFQSTTDGPSKKITDYIFWCRDNRTPISIKANLDKFMDDGRIKKVKNLVPLLSIPHGDRWYRKTYPPKLKSKPVKINDGLSKIESPIKLFENGNRMSSERVGETDVREGIDSNKDNVERTETSVSEIRP